MDCLTPKIIKVPEGDWLCANCEVKGSNQLSEYERMRLRKMEENERELVRLGLKADSSSSSSSSSSSRGTSRSSSGSASGSDSRRGSGPVKIIGVLASQVS